MRFRGLQAVQAYLLTLHWIHLSTHCNSRWVSLLLHTVLSRSEVTGRDRKGMARQIANSCRNKVAYCSSFSSLKHERWLRVWSGPIDRGHFGSERWYTISAEWEQRCCHSIIKDDNLLTMIVDQTEGPIKSVHKISWGKFRGLTTCRTMQLTTWQTLRSTFHTRWDVSRGLDWSSEINAAQGRMPDS